MDNKGSDGQSG